MAVTPGNQEAKEAPMKSRVFTITSLLALLLALCAASVASAQDVTPGGDVYVKDFVQGDGNTDVEDDVAGDCVESDTGGNGDGAEECAEEEKPTPTNEVAADCADGAAVDPVTGQPCTVATVSSGDLPFTGFEAGLVALAGLGLLGLGFGMRRMTRGNAA